MRDLKVNKVILIALVFALLILPVQSIFGWSDHPNIAYPILMTMDEVKNASAEAETLQSFLQAEEAGLVKFLAEQEKWLAKNIKHYQKLPESLVFKATGETENIQERFLNAIRVNPTLSYRLYLQLAPWQKANGREEFTTKDFTFLKNPVMDATTYVKIEPKQRVEALLVVTSANDEPDFGMDIGLYEDEDPVTKKITEFGKKYGFGKLPFGNPNLPYGTQAPFHMGFYHNSAIVSMAASYLDQTYPEYRIRMYRKLSAYAFKTGHDYWGWRFMGWGMHYLGDLSQPYHTTSLPGINTAGMIWIQASGGIDDAIQLVSNRHTAIESFQQSVMRKALQVQNWEHPILKVMQVDNALKEDFSNKTVLEGISAESDDASGDLDSVLEENIPERLVSGPTFELSGTEENNNIVEIIRKEKGEKAVENLTKTVAEQMVRFSKYNRSYVKTILKEGNKL